MKGTIMTDNNVTETIEQTVDEEVVPRIQKIKNRLKQVDPIVYTTAAVAVVGAVGFLAYKRIDNFEAREAARLIADSPETVTAVVEV